MSANMFAPQKPATTATAACSTKIPMPSPTPLRRSASLRIRGEIIPSVVIRASNPHQQKHHPHNPGGGSSGGGGGGGGGAALMETAKSRPMIKTPGASPRVPQSPARNRSLSLSLSNTRLSAPRSPSSVATSSPRTPPTTPDTARQRHNSTSTGYLDWDDTESINSTTSGLSTTSCDHASVARNGTTFSGRSMKYVVHCNQHAGATGEDYLTPTQRAYKQVKRLKTLLQQAQNELERKDSDIVKLTKEVVELRLYKAALGSPEDKSTSSDAVTVRENTSEQATPVDFDGGVNHLGDMTGSFADSGHFEDYTNSSVHSKDSVDSHSPYKPKQTQEQATLVDLSPKSFDQERDRLVAEYERRIQELVRTHEEESHSLKQKHNDKVEELLQRLTEINTRYWALVPDLETAKDRIRELEQQLEEASKKLQQQEEKQKQMYLQMFNQGQEAARLEQEKQVLELAQTNPSRVSVPELLQQLQVTQKELENIKDLDYASSNNSQPLLSAKEAVSLWVLGARKAMYRQLMEAKGSKNKIDPEITLQFLKSAIYYFLTDRENNQGHLRAIQSILGFTPAEISTIQKARSN